MQRVGEHGILKDDDPSLRASTFHDAAWYGLLFAVLGSGCQFSETEPQDRILRTRVFGQSAGALSIETTPDCEQLYALSNVFGTQTCMSNQAQR
jgi:hypothetical protein